MRLSLMTPRLLLLVALVVAGCREEVPAPAALDVAARVGTETLTEDDVDEALEVLPIGLDSATARQQVVDHWVRSRLLAQEARRQGLLEEPGVQRQLAENERAVLAAALIDRFFESNPTEPTNDEVGEYFEANRDRLALREPYVLLRLLSTESAPRAQEARDALLQLNAVPTTDSLWQQLVQRFATDPEGAHALSRTYMPESRLASFNTLLAQQVRALAPGEAAPVIESDEEFFVLQVVDRKPAGTEPQRAWIEEELRQRIAIEARNRMLTRQIEQLFNEARSDGRLVFN